MWHSSEYFGILEKVEYPANGPKMTRSEERVLDEYKPDNLKAFEFVVKSSKGMLCSADKNLSV